MNGLILLFLYVCVYVRIVSLWGFCGFCFVFTVILGLQVGGFGFYGCLFPVLVDFLGFGACLDFSGSLCCA